ncbi:hypothetical protein IMZ31_22805 (plasmid) [Pontibacillus sp. ALD_SL1]|uniref:hypothetical protein n=1 Tax=Pontibacillus sp. ALD_SL1 TaxID=2777185 RepID=UPI001A963AB9|nr:hypothetical protein [Pontibacillus sp. ALD_SL1]QST02287.1 hypothetical protein IMZ31_22805 [Pontibacillus sp. ALD_SL1]
MIINLNDFMPQNESWEHFFLKQVGRAFLFQQGMRYIGLEVNGMMSHEPMISGKTKEIIDVVGVLRKEKRSEVSIRVMKKIEGRALLYGEQLSIVEPDKWKMGEMRFIQGFGLNKEEKEELEVKKLWCFQRGCEELGYPERFYEQMKWIYFMDYEMRGIEVKVSREDFKKGFSTLPEYSYVLVPKGLISKEELPRKTGLLEFDFERYNKETQKPREKVSPWKEALKVTKRPKKMYDERFKKKRGSQTIVDRNKHDAFCFSLIEKVAQENTEELLFWSPHMRQLDEGYRGERWNSRFQYQVGEKTKWGLVADRTLGKGDVRYRHECYYKFLAEGQGYSDWIGETKLV